MKIKKVDDKPMVIHTKKKAKLHTHEPKKASIKASKAHYAKLKFEIYDDYTKANITREQMVKKTAEVKQKIAEIESLIMEKQDILDMQKDLFLDAKQEQLTKLSKLDEFDEEVIR